MKKEVFYELMSEKKLDKLSDIEMPITIKPLKNSERILPFVEQIIQKHLKSSDISPKNKNE